MERRCGMKELYDPQEFVEGRDPYRESLLLAIRAIRDEERPGVMRSSLRSLRIVGRHKENPPGPYYETGNRSTLVVRALVIMAGLGMAWGAATGVKKAIHYTLVHLEKKNAGWTGAEAGT
jgi:hypothetical protein